MSSYEKIAQSGAELGGNVMDAISKSMKGESLNGGKKAINQLFGGMEMVGKGIDSGQWTGDGGAINQTFRKGGLDDGNWDYGKIAMSYAGVAGAGRVLSGGGAYKDGNGNTNLAIVPFV